MASEGEVKRGNFSVKRGGQYAVRPGRSREIPLSPELRLDRSVQAVFAGWQADGGRGPYASRGIANVAHSLKHPHRILARRVREAHSARVGYDRVKKLVDAWAEYIDSLYHRTSGEDKTAA
jgi:hypothetical protein